MRSALVPILFAALFAFALLTLWVPAVWPVTVFESGIFLLCIAVLWRKPPARIAYPAIPLTFALIWGLVQWRAHLTAYAFDTEVALLRWASFLCVFIIADSLFADASVARWFREAMLWFSFLVAIWATLQSFTSGGKVLWLFPTDYTFVMGPIVYRNHYAAFVEVVLPVALYEAFRRRSNAFLYTAMAATLYASVIASASRAGAVLSTAEVVLVILLMMARGATTGREAGAVFLRMLLAFGIFTLVVGWERVWERFWQPDPMGVRPEFAQATLHMITAHPVTGTGLGTWPSVYPHYAIVDVGTFANQAHNDWLQFCSEGGIVFGLAMLSLFVWTLRPALRTVWGIGVISVFLHALVDYPFSRPALGSWPILVIGMLAARRWPTTKSGESDGQAAP